MLVPLLSLFIVVHGLVHLLYTGQAARRFELEAGLRWPDAAWALGIFSDPVTRTVVMVVTIAVAIVFAAAGLALVTGQGWWRLALLVGALASTLLYVVAWDGSARQLPA